MRSVRAAALLLIPLLALLLPAGRAYADPALILRGQYLTRAADCEACHTVPGSGRPFAGGRAFRLPVGTLYSPNITAAGIAGYPDRDWLSMLWRGVGRGGRHLYPAMPYPSYTGMSRADALAIKAYLLSLPPVASAIPPNRIRFPFSLRAGMVVWNLFNNPDRRFVPSDRRDAAFNRGAYLATALGHCGQCHTPRTATLGLQDGRAFAGAAQDGWLAYNLTADRSAGLAGWTDAALAAYLSAGQAPDHGPASGPMGEVVSDSLRYLTPADIAAMVVWLRGIAPQPDGPPAAIANPPPPAVDPRGQRLFAQACAGCHLPDGGGRQSAWAGLAGSHSTADPAGTNLVAVLAQGTRLQTPQGQVFMHPFTGGYTDGELAAIANYSISQFGFRIGHVTAAQIERARAPSGGS